MISHKSLLLFSLSIATLLPLSCRKEVTTSPAVEKKIETVPVVQCANIPEFSADSAYLYVREQCDFGARVPNSDAHEKCASYLKNKLANYGAEVEMQHFSTTAFDGTKINGTNIIGSFAPEKGRRIILFSHWDSRPFCDQDDSQFRSTPVMGANDGASGVAVILEIARQIQQQQPNIGVDMVFLDAEDYGDANGESEDSWCLGSQYWANHPHYKKKPTYGILLDMVGADHPHFGVDVTSSRFAGETVQKIWNIANALGYKEYFQQRMTSQLIDDHVYINHIAGIPTVDIIDFNTQRGFPETWHTHNDTPENISKSTLNMVGKTLINLIYRE